MTSVYMFWTGDNHLTENRIRCMEQFKQVSGVPVVLITKDNLHDYILPDHPLHEAYPYLSFTHRADYLRTYFMHFYGGGYSDIKETTGSWTQHFDELYNSDGWMLGYKEIEGGVPVDPGNEQLKSCWSELIGGGAFICKPRTPITQEWYDEMVRRLDNKLELLKIYPATSPIDCSEDSNGRYPLAWQEILGRILSKVCYKYKDRLIRTLPISVFWNYR